MEFSSLYKLYFTDPSNFNEIYQARLNSESTIKLPIEINGYPSFFFFHNAINSLVYRIREKEKKIEFLFDNLPNIAKVQYIKKSLIDEIHFSNSIESVLSTRKEILEIIIDIENKNVKSKRFKGIINKYMMLLNSDSLKLDNSIDVRKIYDEILLEEIKDYNPDDVPDGEIFRKKIVYVTSSSGKTIHEGMFPESKIIQSIDKIIPILNDDSLEPMIRIAIFHYLFSFIHPFYDGNGRLNRYIASYMFSKYYSKIMAYRLSMTIKENLSSYYDAFKQTNDIRNKGDVTTFVYEFLNIIYKSYEKTEIYALDKKSELDKYWEKIKNLNLQKKQKDMLYLLLQAELFSEQGISVDELVNALEISESTCRKMLDCLLESNYVLQKYFGKKKYYSANLSAIDTNNV